jgi:hypothetical protein
MVEIVGTWRLIGGVTRDDDGQPLPPPYGGAKAMGRVTLNADGRMIAVLCDGRPDLPDGAAREYTSYCGAYSFDGARLVTRVDACSDPERMGTDQVRDVSFDGERMILRPPPRVRDGRTEHREIFWEKIADL